MFANFTFYLVHVQYKQYDKVYPFLEEDRSISLIMPDKQPANPDWPFKILGYLSADHASVIKSVMDRYEWSDMTVPSAHMVGSIGGNSNRRDME